LWGHRGARGPEGGHDLCDSLPYPFETAGVQDIFNGKDVLEIGPGNGRQFEHVSRRSKSYCIADISKSALDEPVFKGASEKFLISDWEELLGRVFDVIHFWYVLHHITQGEMRQFFLFVSNHLRDTGVVAFNTPQKINVQHDPRGDGCGTTYSDPVIVHERLETLKVVRAVLVDRKSTGYVILLQKGHTSNLIPYELIEEREMDQIQPDGQSITLVHFAYRHGAELRIACMPGMREFHQTAYHPNYQMTDAAVATTCPGCKKTAEFAQAKGVQR
jgi:SAM-dependent methyltransferase